MFCLDICKVVYSIFAHEGKGWCKTFSVTLMHCSNLLWCSYQIVFRQIGAVDLLKIKRAIPAVSIINAIVKHKNVVYVTLLIQFVLTWSEHELNVIYKYYDGVCELLTTIILRFCGGSELGKLSKSCSNMPFELITRV